LKLVPLRILTTHFSPSTSKKSEFSHSNKSLLSLFDVSSTS